MTARYIMKASAGNILEREGLRDRGGERNWSRSSYYKLQMKRVKSLPCDDLPCFALLWFNIPCHEITSKLTLTVVGNKLFLYVPHQAQLLTNTVKIIYVPLRLRHTWNGKNRHFKPEERVIVEYITLACIFFFFVHSEVMRILDFSCLNCVWSVLLIYPCEKVFILLYSALFCSVVQLHDSTEREKVIWSALLHNLQLVLCMDLRKVLCLFRPCFILLVIVHLWLKVRKKEIGALLFRMLWGSC